MYALKASVRPLGGGVRTSTHWRWQTEHVESTPAPTLLVEMLRLFALP
jgi:hypothetical protein